MPALPHPAPGGNDRLGDLGQAGSGVKGLVEAIEVEVLPRLETVYAKAGEIEFFEALAQDMAQAQIVQQSYHSKGYSDILLNSEERRIRAMHKATDDYVYGPDR